MGRPNGGIECRDGAAPVCIRPRRAVRAARIAALRVSKIGGLPMRWIGVTPSRDEQTGRIGINRDYLDSVARAGALPVLLPLTDDERAIGEMLRRIDGLLLSGGGDVDPALYGEDRLPLCGPIDPLRDRMEFSLCRRALDAGLPILAICRGVQVLNCVLGGTLYQDIAAQFGRAIRHPCHETPRDGVHEVKLTAGTRLRAIAGLDRLTVNSRHHQAVKALGRGLIVSARAEDGLIEGVELPGEKFAVGVQWHPESMSDRRKEAQALFLAFSEACEG